MATCRQSTFLLVFATITGGNPCYFPRILHLVEMWLPDPKMRRFLRPGTIYAEAKFPNYYGQRDAP